MENALKIISLELSLDTMLEENEIKLHYYDERLVAFIRDKQRSSKMEHWNSQDESGNTLLYNAARYDNDIVAQYMIETGSNVNIQNNLGQTPLMIATKNLSKKVIKALLAANANPNAMDSQNHSSLYYLYHYNRTHSDDHLEILKLLIDNFASLTVRVNNLSWCQVDVVLRYGNREAIEILIQANLDVKRNLKDNNTPVHILAKNEHFDVFKALGDCTFDTNARNTKLQTPLYFAVYYGNVYAVQCLLNRDADIDATNGSSGSALHNAVYNFITGCGNQYAKCVELLLEHGSGIQLHTGTLGYVSKMFKNVENKLTYNTGKIVIAYLVVQKALGTKITDETRRIINGNTAIKSHYEFCQQQLSTVIYNAVTLRDLISTDELKFEQYVRNQIWVLKMQKFFDAIESDSHCLGTVLKKRFNRTIQMIKLKKDCADLLCGMIKLEYASFHLAANRIISFLSKEDLHFLSRVSL